jgi:hypothetical protein
MNTEGRAAPAPRVGERLSAVLDKVSAALAGLQFGEVRLVVHDGAVVQVERTEKVRIHMPRSP